MKKNIKLFSMSFLIITGNLSVVASTLDHKDNHVSLYKVAATAILLSTQGAQAKSFDDVLDTSASALDTAASVLDAASIFGLFRHKYSYRNDDLDHTILISNSWPVRRCHYEKEKRVCRTSRHTQSDRIAPGDTAYYNWDKIPSATTACVYKSSNDWLCDASIYAGSPTHKNRRTCKNYSIKLAPCKEGHKCQTMPWFAKYNETTSFQQECTYDYSGKSNGKGSEF